MVNRSGRLWITGKSAKSAKRTAIACSTSRRRCCSQFARNRSTTASESSWGSSAIYRVTGCSKSRWNSYFAFFFCVMKASHSSLHTFHAYQGKFLPRDYQRRYSPGNFFGSRALHWLCTFSTPTYAVVDADDLTMGDCFAGPGYLQQDVRKLADSSVSHANANYVRICGRQQDRNFGCCCYEIQHKKHPKNLKNQFGDILTPSLYASL